jgi:metal-responsive CopG/Arc/MetJ family transcriptional regulator
MYKYAFNSGGQPMRLKQISLTLPKSLFEVSKEYSEEYGFRTIQEFILDLLRNKVFLEKAERYREIEERMKRGVGIKKFNRAKALKYLKGM